MAKRFGTIPHLDVKDKRSTKMETAIAQDIINCLREIGRNRRFLGFHEASIIYSEAGQWRHLTVQCFYQSNDSHELPQLIIKAFQPENNVKPVLTITQNNGRINVNRYKWFDLTRLDNLLSSLQRLATNQ